MLRFGDWLGTVRGIFQIGSRAAENQILRFNNGFQADLVANPTAARTWTLPDKSGVIALTTDVLVVDKKTQVSVFEDFHTNAGNLITAKNGYSDVGFNSRSYTAQATHPGVVVLLVGKDANSHARVGVDYNAFSLSSGSWNLSASFRIRNLPAATENVEYFIGFTNNVPSENSNSSCGLRWRANADGSIFQLATRDTTVDGTVSLVSTGISVVANTWYSMKLVVTPSPAKAELFINNTKVAETTTKVPVAATKIMGAICSMTRPTVSTDTTEYISDFDYFEVICNLTNSR